MEEQGIQPDDHLCGKLEMTGTRGGRKLRGNWQSLVLPEKTDIKTRKHEQSYRHADPRRQQQHTAVAARITSNRATVTVFVTV